MLAQHPANLLLRFALEVTALVGIGQWGWETFQGFPRYLAALGLPLVFALLWMTFGTPGDTSRGKPPLKPVPGRVRLSLEAFFFLFAIFCFFASGQPLLALFFSIALLLHYFWSAERVVWLIRN
jgi:hypothetical protein